MPNPLDVVLSTDFIVLRGTGDDIQPSLLSGSVVLNLPEALPLKALTLQLRGKTMVPPPSQDRNQKPSHRHHKRVAYSYHWSFLQGDSGIHTLKSGRNEFPFQVTLDSSIPASMSSQDRTANVVYKLRATAVRPGFSTNFVSTKTIRVVRGYTEDALEYQQTLDIESSWAGKVMYSFMTPHKAWAAGDSVAASVKFIPLRKGVKVVGITTSLQEKTKFSWHAINHENIKTVATVRHHIVEGNPVLDVPCAPDRDSSSPRHLPPQSIRHPQAGFPVGTGCSQPTAALPSAEDLTRRASSSGRNEHTAPHSQLLGAEDLHGDGEVDAIIKLHLPSTILPTHPIAPLVISHRLRWEVMILNPDGHISELRCSLPIHILDNSLLREAWTATHANRTALLGESFGADPPPQETLLPAYQDHILDRVANVDVPSTGLAVNPLSFQSRPASPDILPAQSIFSVPRGSADAASIISRASSMPDASEISNRAVLIDSELLVSLGQAGRNFLSNSLSGSSGPSRASSPNGDDRGSVISGTKHGRRHSIFNFRPFTALSKSNTKNSFSLSPQARTYNTLGHTPAGPSLSSTPSPSSSPTSEIGDLQLLSDMYSTVPDYHVAARGFLGGGVTPLSTIQGLPNYDEAERQGGNRIQAISDDTQLPSASAVSPSSLVVSSPLTLGSSSRLHVGTHPRSPVSASESFLGSSSSPT